MPIRTSGPAAPAAAMAVLLLAGCGSARAAAGNTPHTSARASHVASGSAAVCPPPSARRAWAVEVSAAGSVRWRTPIPTRGNGGGQPTGPVTAGPVGVFAQDGAVYGLRLADGHRLWSWPGGRSVYGMWRWQGLVVVLTDQVSANARLTGLDAASGHVRWSLRLPGQGLLGAQAATADGGLAMMRTDGVLEVVSLATGHVRWTRRTGTSVALTAAAGLVQFGTDGRMTGYDDLTGRPRWTVTGGPAQPQSQLARGLVLVTSDVSGGAAPTAMTAIVPATGRVAWRFDPGTAVTLLGAGAAGLVLATGNPDRLYLLNPATGRPRWQADTVAGLFGDPLVTATAVVTAEGRLSARLVDRDAATGRVRWTRPLTAVSPVQPVIGLGPLALLQGSGAPGQPSPLFAYRLSGGSLAWRAAMPAFVSDPVLPVPGGLLIQPADLLQACAAPESMR